LAATDGIPQSIYHSRPASAAGKPDQPEAEAQLATGQENGDALSANPALPSSSLSSVIPSASPPVAGSPDSIAAPSARANATFVTLARNSDIWSLARSVRDVEDRFNSKHHYDWVFLNDHEFTDEFKRVISNLVSGTAKFGLIPKEHWTMPPWIDEERAALARKEMKRKKVIYGDSVSYRHMCRFESGFFFRHELLLDYEYYWRVEPDVKYFCDINFDPFRFMADHNKKYSFVISLYEYQETIPTLWNSVKKFVSQFPQHLAANNSLEFISHDHGLSYNGCHFWSNFEIGSLKWLRSDAYMNYFNFLDQEGGFFYERWGDAPVHSIAAALLLNKDEIHFFDDIAYYHIPFMHCPSDSQLRLDLKCSCNPDETFDWEDYSCEYFVRCGWRIDPIRRRFLMNSFPYLTLLLTAASTPFLTNGQSLIPHRHRPILRPSSDEKAPTV